MAKNGTITKTTWTAMAAGDKVTAANITELQTAIAALEGYAKNVDNCGFTNFCQKCQSCQGCQSCQSKTCQSNSCQGCQSTSCQACQLYHKENCNCNCNCNCGGGSDDS